MLKLAMAKDNSHNHTNFFLLSGAVLAVTFLLNFAPWFNLSNDLNTIITLLVGLLFVLVYGAKALGWRNLITFIVLTFVISFAAEAIGVATGLIFGPYYYTDLLGPKILGVPPMIQVGYTAMGFASFLMARSILGMQGAPKTLKGILANTLLGALIMVAWDVAMDPFQSTVGGDWIWTTGGQYFGIGMHNYFGWFATVFLFMLAYSFFAKENPEQGEKDLFQSKFFLSQPALYYAFIAIGMVVVPWVGGVDKPYAQPQNYDGSVQILTYSLALITTFVMGIPVVSSLLRIFINPEKD